MKFAFVVHKAKAQKIGQAFLLGCKRRNFDCRLVQPGDSIRTDETGIFYGVVPETWNMWQHCLADRRAVYLDNGWSARRDNPTLRWAWNGVQAPFDRLPRDVERRKALFPVIAHRPQAASVRDRALVCLQTPNYFTNVRVGYSQTTWLRVVGKMLKDLGYTVTVRDKPNKRNPEAVPLQQQLQEHGIVVSLNSAVNVAALCQGVSAYHTVQSGLGPLCEFPIKKPHEAKEYSYKGVAGVLNCLAFAETTYEDLRTGDTARRLIAIPEQDRVGINYDQ